MFLCYNKCSDGATCRNLTQPYVDGYLAYAFIKSCLRSTHRNCKFVIANLIAAQSDKKILSRRTI